MTEDTLRGDIPHSREDLYRPGLLPRTFEPLTRRAFTEAGLRQGMRVLDVWSGSGDVALLAREFVGSEGHVTGFDQSSVTISHANDRAAYCGLSNVEFVEADIESLPFGQDFDVIVGRMVLMFRPCPVRDLQALVRCLKPGGLVLFQELDMLPGRTVPASAVIDEARAWMLDFFSGAGLELEMGSKLYAVFRAAGLSVPEMRVDGFIGGSESGFPKILASVARMMLPPAQAMGTISAEEVQIDTLEQRMRVDLARTGGVISTALLIGAWARLPK